MNIEEIKIKIRELKKLKSDNFLTIDEQTEGFYNGQIFVYEIWFAELELKSSLK
jgi:hypothetical protein